MGDYQEIKEEKLGASCIDGGTCHHSCISKCFRRQCCDPLTGFEGDWLYPKDDEASQEGESGQQLSEPDLPFKPFVARRGYEETRTQVVFSHIEAVQIVNAMQSRTPDKDGWYAMSLTTNKDGREDDLHYVVEWKRTVYR